MDSSDIIHDLVTSDRDLIDDADEITPTDGFESIEVHHRSHDDESAVVLTYSAATQYRRDPGDPVNEFDIFDADVETSQ